VSKRPNEIKEDNFDPGPEIKSNHLTHILGNDQFQVLEWVDWREDLFAVPIRLFFNWKRIDRHEDYFNIDFARVLHPKTDDYFCVARCHGLEAQDFAKVVVTVAHFVYRLPTVIPQTIYIVRGRLHPRQIHSILPFAMYLLAKSCCLGDECQGPRPCEVLLKGTAVGWKGERLRFDTLKVLPSSDFQAHSKFLILALSLLLEVGVLEVFYQTYPTTPETTLSLMISMSGHSRS